MGWAGMRRARGNFWKIGGISGVGREMYTLFGGRAGGLAHHEVAKATKKERQEDRGQENGRGRRELEYRLQPAGRRVTRHEGM